MCFGIGRGYGFTALDGRTDGIGCVCVGVGGCCTVLDGMGGVGARSPLAALARARLCLEANKEGGGV